MTCDERLAELGVDPATISLHKDRCDALYERFYKVSEATAQKTGIGVSALTMVAILLHEIAERGDIIDRMETRIVNLTGERDFLAKRLSDMGCGCGICLYADQPADGIPCQDCYSPPKEKHFVFAGVPEDWRPTADEP